MELTRSGITKIFVIGFLLGLVAGGVPSVILYQQAQVRNETSWSVVVAILKNGQVSEVSQLHNGEVTLTLKDGTQIITRGPHLDDIFREIERCGSPCKDTMKVTE